MYRIHAKNVPEAYEEFIWTFKAAAVTEQSRNGEVLTIPDYSVLEIDFPMQRVLFDAKRDANPFFHVMEFVWMMAGTDKIDWLLQFNKRMKMFSDDLKTLPASYGYRWRTHWQFDQLQAIIVQLKRDPESRRAVLTMWDPEVDLIPNSKKGLDKPCNTNIFFRIRQGRLNMLVCNRSNDAMWGMFGANCVHMTFLQEFVARAIGCELGSYSVVTMNLHVYTGLPNITDMLQPPSMPRDYYTYQGLVPYPLLAGDEKWTDFLKDCERFVDNATIFKTDWMTKVALPIKRAYLDKAGRPQLVTQIAAQDWRVACTEWEQRRPLSE